MLSNSNWFFADEIFYFCLRKFGIRIKNLRFKINIFNSAIISYNQSIIPPCNKKETPTQLFSCKICEIFNNTFFTEHLRWLLLIEAIWYFNSVINRLLCKCFDFKGTVMQIEKALINDRLRVSKISWKICIPTTYNFAVIYPWNLPFS